MGYGPIKADRSLIGWLLLSLVTCGIYSFYFLYCLARDVNTLCQDDGDYTPGLAEFILLSFVTCGFYAYYWYYKIGNRLQANAPRYGWCSRKTAPPFFCGRSSARSCAALVPSSL